MIKSTPITFSNSNEYRTMSVIIVDDLPLMVSTMVSMFNDIGFQKVHKAYDGRDALLMLKKQNYDLIVADWNMPRVNGLDLLKAVRENERTRKTPFIMITGNVNQSDVITAINSGVSEYLIKPFSKTMLKNRIGRAFRSPISGPTAKSNSVFIEDDTQLAPPEKNSILLVDDEPTNLLVLNELLKDDYKLQSCKSGIKAIEICAKKNKPDLILLDIMMPEMDGLAVCKKLKSDPETEHIPIIFVSALTQTADVVKGLALGAIDYVIKPITPEILLARVNTHMKLVQQHKNMSVQVDTLMDNIRLRDDIEHIFQHDLRNPFTSILAAVSRLEKNASGCTEEIAMIKDSSAVIHKMVEQQTMMHKLENDEYEPRYSPIDSASLIKRIITDLSLQIDEKKIDVQVSIKPDITFSGDDALSYNLFFNLVNNAIQAAPNESTVSIVCAEIKNTLCFSISNQGEVADEIRGRFFEKFVTHGKVNGTGLGTYSAKLAVNVMKGKISLDSSVENNTEIQIILNK